MPKRIYQVGEPCDTCQTPTIAGRGGEGYCKPCYVKWAEANKSNPPQQTTYTPTRDFDAEARGKVRHGVVCAMLQAGKSYEDIAPKLMQFENLIMNGAPTPEEKFNESLDNTPPPGQY